MSCHTDLPLVNIIYVYRILLTVCNSYLQVASIYKNHTLENNVNIVVKRVVVLESEDVSSRVRTFACHVRSFSSCLQ